MRQLPSITSISISNYIGAYKERFQAFWQSLTFAQRCYLLACMAYFSFFMAEVDPNNSFSLLIVSSLVLVALINEFWPKFLYFWNSLPGKSIIFLFYATIANFALVQAAGHVNDITGVSSDHFPYTHNLSVLLSLPTWFITTSVAALLLLQLLMPIYILCLLLIKPFGLANLWHPPCYRFPILTGIIRFGLSFILTINMAMFLSSSGLAHGVNLIVANFVQVASKEPVQVKVNINDNWTSANIDMDSVSTSQPTISKTDPEHVNSQNTADEIRSVIAENTARSERFVLWQQQVLANFIYNQEADSKSRCQLTPDSRVVELNDYEILEIIQKQDEQGDASYTFTVKPCISAAIGHQFRSQE